MNLRKLAMIPIMTILVSVVIAFAIDFFTLFIYREDIRTQVYIGGFYVAGISADVEAAAGGADRADELYKDEDILEAFKDFSKSSFSIISENNYEEQESPGKVAMKFDVEGRQMINNIQTGCEIKTLGGTKGVTATVEYQVDPRLNLLFGYDIIPEPYRMNLQRNFRILGQ